MKEILLQAPDNQLDASMHPLISKWSDPPKAIEILEVLDKCIFGSLASGIIVSFLQIIYNDACKSENISNEDVVKLATWREDNSDRAIRAHSKSEYKRLETLGANVLPPIESKIVTENPYKLPDGSNLEWVYYSFFAAGRFDLYKDGEVVGWIMEGLSSGLSVWTAFDNRNWKGTAPLLKSRETLEECSRGLVRMVTKFGPWEPHENFETSEVRKSLKTGEVVAQVFPESVEHLDPWVWKVGGKYGWVKLKDSAKIAADKELLK
jgi:hypothetical protein